MSAIHTESCWLFSETAEGEKMLLVGGLEVYTGMCTLTDEVGCYNVIF